MNYAIILAGGTGTRAGGNLPKQFQMLGEKPVLWWSLNAFRRFDPDIILVLVMHPDYRQLWIELNEATGNPVEAVMCEGGRSRTESVFNGLRTISEYCRKKKLGLGNPEHSGHECAGKDVVMVHDGARPLVTRDVIEDALSKVRNGAGVVPAIPLTDSIREVIRTENDRSESDRSIMVDRNRFKAVQTPQVFMMDDLTQAYGDIDFDDKALTDDGSVAERAGIKIVLSKGDPINIKITDPNDFRIAEALLPVIEK